MNDTTLSMILIKLSTMDGKYWPAIREGEPIDADRASYAEILYDLTEDVGQRVLCSMLTAFPQRPSHKSLREWAISLVPQPTFDICQLDTPSTLRLTTGGSLKPASSGIPESVKAQFARFRAQVPPEEVPSEVPLRKPVYFGHMPENQRGKWTRDAARWLKAQGVSAPSVAVLAATAEAKWREAQRRSTRAEAPAPTPAAAGR